MSNHKVVIVGAGFGGNGVMEGLTTTATTTTSTDQDETSSLALPAGISVTLVDTKSTFSIGASWQFLWSSRISTQNDDNMIPKWEMQHLKAAHTKGVEVMTNQTVHQIHATKNQIELESLTSLEYDTLVLAPGVISDPSPVPGLTESSFALDICNPHHVPIIKERLDKLLQEAKEEAHKAIAIVVTRMPYKCPPVPFQVASIVDDLRREHNVKDNVKIIVSVPVPFPFAGPPAAKLFKAKMKEQDIDYWPNHVVEKVNDNTIHYKDENDQSKELTADLLLCTFPQRAPDFCKPLCNPKGFIPVDLQTNLAKNTANNNIYAIGDACHAHFPKPDKPHPKAGEFAYLMGVHVGQQIVANLTDTSLPPPRREANCVAEFGLNGQGVAIQPNFTDILQNPNEGMPKFQFPIVENVHTKKLEWINDYVSKFVVPGKDTPFGSK